jgi:hypothetical protein
LILSGEQMRDKIFLESIAKNDGLTLANFLLWFPFAFNGQIICWNAFIDYQILKYPVT